MENIPDMQQQLKELRQFRTLIIEHFNLDELRTLCFDLGIDYEVLSGDNKPVKVRELILFHYRKGNVKLLLDHLHQTYSFVSWPSIENLPTTIDHGQKIWEDDSFFHGCLVQIGRYKLAIYLLAPILIGTGIYYGSINYNEQQFATHATQTAQVIAIVVTQQSATPTPISAGATQTSGVTQVPPTDLPTPILVTTPTPMDTPMPTSTPLPTSLELLSFSTAIGYTEDLAFGDCDNDGYEDLAIAPGWGKTNHTTLEIHRNQNGQSFSRVQDLEVYGTSLAWGDVDGDMNLDLAVGSHTAPNRIYRNIGNCFFVLYWEATSENYTFAITLVDWDNDQDLDLAIGNVDSANLIYENDNGTFSQSPIWTDPYAEPTYSIDWADWDKDGFVDLIVGNLGSANRLYRNVSAGGGARDLVSVWTDPSSYTWTRGVEWGDLNDDGYPDLAIANLLSGKELVYINNRSGTGGWVDFGKSWESNLGERSYNVKWVDFNNDGYLDLSVAQGADDSGVISPAHHTRIYCGDGVTLSEDPCWSTDEPGYAAAIDWSDLDCDGDQDMGLGNYGDNPNPDGIGPVADLIYENKTIDLPSSTCPLE